MEKDYGTASEAGLMVISKNGFTNEFHYLALLCVKNEFRGQGVGIDGCMAFLCG